MPLLVSVRSAEEVAAALAGGADIIDAKEPQRGSLGAVDSAVLEAIAACTPRSVPLSVALGDCADADQARAAVRAALLPGREATVYLKIGFAGVRAMSRVTEVLRAAVEAAAAASAPHAIVAVAYADHDAAAAPAPEEVLRAVDAAGGRGLLVDTWSKDGRGLLDHIAPERLAGLAAGARASGLLFALAGSLDPEAVARLAPLADVVGVRGAACRGGRNGAVAAPLVAELRSRLAAGRAALAATR